MTTTPATSRARVAGLDVARAVALFGMFAAHVGNDGEIVAEGWRWLAATHGRSSALFTVLAGVSIALMLTRSRAEHPVRHTRVRVAMRGVILLGLGWVLAAIGTPVDVILDNLGVMFLMSLVAFRWRPAVLLGVGFGILVVGEAVLVRVVPHLPTWLYDLPVVHELWGIHYPALLWIGYVFIGMGIGKLAPWRGGGLGLLAMSGLILATIAYGTGAWLLVANGGEVQWGDIWPRPDEWFAISAHTYTPFEMLGNVGVAFAVIAGCCWIAGLLPRLTWPLAAAGSMTLTLYSAHLVVIAIVGPEIAFRPSNHALVSLCVGGLLFATLWRWRVGQGPLERMVTTASNGVAEWDARRVSARV